MTDSRNGSSAASEDQKSPEMLAKRLRHAFTTMTNDDESKAQSERRARMMVRQDAILDAAEHIEAEPKTLLGMIAAIYGSLDAEDCAMVDREWRKFRSMPDAAQAALEPVAWRWKWNGQSDDWWRHSATAPSEAVAIKEPLYASQPSPAATVEIDVLSRLVDWAYLHATEGEVWPSSKTKADLITRARQDAPRQEHADGMKAAAPQRSSAGNVGAELLAHAFLLGRGMLNNSIADIKEYNGETWQAALDEIAPLIPAVTADEFLPRDAWNELVHKDDRTSPEDYPDMCLISFDELKDYMERHTSALTRPNCGSEK